MNAKCLRAALLLVVLGMASIIECGRSCSRNSSRGHRHSSHSHGRRCCRGGGYGWGPRVYGGFGYYDPYFNGYGYGYGPWGYGYGYAPYVYEPVGCSFGLNICI